MNMFSKEEYDVSRVFLTYLAFLGNTTKVGIVLKIPAEVVEVLAAKEDWEGKLDIYMGLRHVEALEETDRAVRRSVNLIQACQMRDLIARLLNYIHKHFANDDEGLLAWLSPRNPKTNHPRFDVKVLLDLARALHVATRVVALTILVDEKNEETDEELTERQRLTMYAAMDRAMRSMDQLPGIDSVTLAKDSLARWESKERQA